MKKLFLVLRTVLVVLFLCLMIPLSAKAAQFQSLEDVVNTQDLATYLCSEFEKGTQRILVEDYEIPTELWDEVVALFAVAKPESTLGNLDYYYWDDGYEKYLYSIEVSYTTEDVAAIDEAAAIYLRGLEGNTSITDAEKALIIFDRMSKGIGYDTGNTERKGVQYILENGDGDWYSYYQTRAYLMSRAGVPCFITTSNSENSWNVAYINGKLYKIAGNGGGYADSRVDHTNFLTSNFGSSGYGTEYDDYGWQTGMYFLVDDSVYCLVGESVYKVRGNQLIGEPIGTIPDELFQRTMELGDWLIYTCVTKKQVRYLNVKTGEDGVLHEFANAYHNGIMFFQYDKDTFKIRYEEEVYEAFTDTAHTVVFKDWNGSVLQSGTYRFGQMVIPPDDPDRAGYHFAGWDKPVDACEGNTVYTATYVPYSRTNGWHEDHDRWIYTVNDKRKTGWLCEQGKWYYLDDASGYMTANTYVIFYGNEQLGTKDRIYFLNSNGVMHTGWREETEGEWLYFLPSGELVDGWQLIGGRWYYFDGYYMHIGWYEENGKCYYLDENIGMVTGFKTIDGKKYYFDANGARVEYSWRQVNGKWYYFGYEGRMQTGQVLVGGVYYLLDENGVMQTGWRYMNGDWYYFNPSGAMAERWAYIGGKWYYFSDTYNYAGQMCTGLIEDGGHTYYLDEQSGAMVTGWRKIKVSNFPEYWYFFDADGRAATGWYKTGGKWYYFDEDCHMQTEFVTVGGVLYYLGSDGAMRTGWYKAPSYYWIDGKLETEYCWHYANAGGATQTGWLYYGGSYYYLEKAFNGRMTTGRRMIDNKWYEFSDSGILIS